MRAPGAPVIPGPSSAPPAAPPPAPLTASVHYGGPDQPPRVLRELLLAKIQASPPGSDIDWATYYFSDQGLADALIAAKARGVNVRVVVEAQPRTAAVNAATIGSLRQGLGEGLSLHRSWLRGSHLHAKIYAFSAPQPDALIGSYNPSGDVVDDPRLADEIGDQDRGENLLVDFREPAVARALQAQVRRLWSGRGYTPFSRRQNRPVQIANVTLYFYPRLRSDVVERTLAHLGPGDSVRAAVSHMDDGGFAQGLGAAARRGAKIQLIVHDTTRRVPEAVVLGLRRAGVAVQRYCVADRLPMHAKFVIVERHQRRAAWFGSLNYNLTSRYLNQEVLARSTDADLVDDLEGRFRVLTQAADKGDCVAAKP
ncbi:phosphatidylserine/phosphatidylglycerophosphate/cardiolipin synthase family protein [Phenylobacterium sp.]|uniref:phospholipase D-like domain-containing protein n=1 Tax=Phenylobacterium sp. TaxID=1871053 RepID=UPI0025ED87FC|nr:phospholipase D family protein [Phenylobacterium sp.]